MNLPIRWLAAPFLLALLGAPELHAQDRFWNPASTSGNWDAATAIWGTADGGPYATTWVDGSVAHLDAAPGGSTATLTAAINTNGILFSGDFTIAAGGGSLTLPDSATIQSTGSTGDHLFVNTPILGASLLDVGTAGGGSASVYLNASNSFLGTGLQVEGNTRVAIGNSGTAVGTVQSGTLAGDVLLQSSSAVIGFESTQTYSGVVSGPGNLEVVSPTAGATTLTLISTQTLSGTVRVMDRSTLALVNDGSTTAGAVAVASINLFRNATLDTTAYTDGTWRLSGLQTLLVRGNSAANGGRILGNARIEGLLDLTDDPTSRAGTLRQEGGNLTVAGGANWRMNITTWTGTTPGADFSQVRGVSGAKLDLNDASSGSKIRITLRGQSLTGFDSSTASSWVIADFSDGNTSGGIIAFAPDKFQIVTSSFGQNLNGGTFSVSTDANQDQLILNFTPVPEPSALLGVAAVGLGLGGLARSRLRRAAVRPARS